MMSRVLGTIPPPTLASLIGSCLLTQPEGGRGSEGLLPEIEFAGQGMLEGHRLMRLILEPSRFKLYISPCGSRTKAMMGLVTVSVSMAPPAPTVAP